MILEFLNQNSAAIQGISTLALVIITLWYAWWVRKSVKENERSRKREFLPVLEPEITALDLSNIRITVTNLGSGVAQDIKIYFPTIQDPRKLPNLGGTTSTRGHRSRRVDFNNINSQNVLDLPERDRILRVEYEDIFGRKIISEALIKSESNNQSSGRYNHLTIEPWKLITPND